jgi:diacylglycerol kinase (ATP)
VTKKQIRFIVNPISGVGKQKIIPKLIEQHLDATQWEHEIVYTEASKHAIELTKQAADKGIDVVAIVGGDGSVNEAGSALVGQSTALAIIPTGSGNGLARHLGISTKLSTAISLLNNYQVKTIDTGTINNHPFMGMAGTGFDALIAKKFAEYGKRGFFSYFKIILREYRSYKNKEYLITYNDQTITRKAFLITAANSSQYGNRVTVSPHAKVDDGSLELCILKPFPGIMMPWIAFRFFTRSIDKSRCMETLKGQHFVIEQNDEQCHADGEPIALKGPLSIDVKPASLKVIVPKD